jgi:tetratricopeptide (TPR) repeat protein
VNPQREARSWVCELYVRTPDRSGWHSGSGTLISRDLVLTAGHVGRLGAEVVVRPLHGGGDHLGTVVWSGGDRDADAALVRVPGLAAGYGRAPELRWGRLVCDSPGTQVQAVGFPWTRVSSRDGWRDTEELIGTVRPMGLAKAGLIDVAVESAPRERGESEPAPWSGMSGAGLFCNQALIGVVIQDDLPMASRRVRAVRVSDFADDREFCELVWPGTEEARPGLEPAELIRLQQRVAPLSSDSPASLLRADAEVVPFHGRQELLSRLQDWCDGPPSMSGWLLTGPGGQGKTRLGRHFAGLLQRRGWATVVLAPKTPDADLPLLSSVRVPLLLVIDYAEQRQGQLELLGPVLLDRDREATLRVLLLARGAGEWSKTFPREWDFLADRIAEHTEELPALDDTAEQRRRAFGAAVSAFAGRLQQAEGLGEAADAAWEDRVATAIPPVFRSPSTALDVQLAALVALLRTSASGQGYDPGTAARYLLYHEQRYWERIAEQHKLGRLRPISQRAAVAAACLVPADSPRQALVVLSRVPGIRDWSEGELSSVASWLRELYPSPGQFWGSLQPDLLAERHVADTVKEQDDLLTSLLEQVDDGQASQALTVLARAAACEPNIRPRVTEVIARYPEVLASAAVRVALEVNEYQVLADALARVAANSRGQLGLLRTIYRAIPHQTQVHGQLAATMAEEIAAALRPALPPGWDGHRPERVGTPGGRMAAPDLAAVLDLARALDELSVRLQAIGRLSDALPASNEAVSICERLAEADSPQCLADLAAFLNNQANCLDELGRRPDALRLRCRAVKAYRQLAGPGPEMIGAGDDLGLFANLATALSNLATDLDTGEGLEHARESVRICRLLAAVDTRFKADQARSLSNLSVSLSGSGLFPEALDAAREAVELYQALAEDRPDTHRPRLAASYTNLSRCLAELGQTWEALNTSGEALAQYRLLARFHPDAYRPDLARAYRHRADRMAELGLTDGALMEIDEAIELYGDLAKQRPTAFGDELERCRRIRADLAREAGSADEGEMG